MVEDLARQAAELIQRAVDTVKSVFNRSALSGGRKPRGSLAVHGALTRAIRIRR